MHPCSSLLVLFLSLVVSTYAQSTSDEPSSNPPKKANGVMIALIVVFVGLVCVLVFYYLMNIIRKNRKRKDAAALPQYVDLTPLQGLPNQGTYNPFQRNPTIVITPPEPTLDHQHPQDDQTPPPYELPTQPPPAQLRTPS
ncbi:hypothetical protein ACGC1H_002626 [Rhizoctonia solani]|uniref:Uncharacterized protein n=1 Tax=Rhizoctonia solani TaxID=456999 RepID=A0A8H2XIS4_9AGAM|nr:unnamed protein product [Rhizoctonia solani]